MRWNGLLLAEMALLVSMFGCSGGATAIHSDPNVGLTSGSGVSVQSDGPNDGTSRNNTTVQNSPRLAVANRHIIYNADISVEVSDLDRMTEQLDARLKELQGFVSNFSEQRFEGDRRTAIWTVRIDATKFSDFLRWLDNETNVVRKQVTSKDVTEEYVDLTSRLSSKQATEKRMKVLLEEHSGKLEEVLAFEREIDRTREEIERIEGRLRMFQDQISLSTIVLTASTRVDYLAPGTETLATAISETWMQSVGKLQEVCRWFLLAFIGLVPWCPILAMLAGLWWLAKAASRRFAKQIS